MGSGTWKTLIFGLGAVVVAVTTGTAVMAAINDQDEPPAARHTFDSESSCIEGATGCDDAFDAAGGACLAGSADCNDTPGVVSAVCAPDHPDCEDMIVEGDGFEQCATDEPCGDFDARCAADTACIEPWLMDAPFCPEGTTYEECFPDGVPAGWDCVQLESFPVQVKCYPFGCTPVDGPISILPLPAEDLPLEVKPQVEPVDPSLVDPGIAIGEPVPVEPIECLPPVECGPNETCIAPDCAVSSDGSVFCPDPAPVPCDEAAGDDGGCSSPGSCGDLGCSGEGYACPDGITDDECVKLTEEQRQNSGGGSSGSGGSTEAIE